MPTALRWIIILLASLIVFVGGVFLVGLWASTFHSHDTAQIVGAVGGIPVGILAALTGLGLYAALD